MTIQETHSHTQPIRRVDKNEGAANEQPPATYNILHIACHPDVSSGNDIILWSDILAAFEDVVHVRYGTTILSFLKGPDLQILNPLCIAAVPGATLDVVVRAQLDNAENNLFQLEMLSRTPSEELSLESLQEALPTVSQQNKKSTSVLVPNTITTAAAYSDLNQTTVRANLGDKDAQVALGDMYKDGLGVQKDYKAAMEWYLRAAEQGDAVGLRKVGVLYDYGYGVTQDYSTALA
ncbi:hypothetical protein BGX30_004654, partial [Mortierella sp. GBA39]